MDDAELDPSPDEISLEQALEAVARRLVGFTTAVDGFAERQQDLLGRDYSEDLAALNRLAAISLILTLAAIQFS